MDGRAIVELLNCWPFIWPGIAVSPQPAVAAVVQHSTCSDNESRAFVVCSFTGNGKGYEESQHAGTQAGWLIDLMQHNC